MAAPWVCSMLRSAALHVSMQPSRLVWSWATMSSDLVLSNRASLSDQTEKRTDQPEGWKLLRDNNIMSTEYDINIPNRASPSWCSPVDASSIHKIRDVPTGPLDRVKGFQDLLLFWDVTAESRVVSYRAHTHTPGLWFTYLLRHCSLFTAATGPGSLDRLTLIAMIYASFQA